MSRTESRSYAWIPWVSASVFGMFAGYGAWLLAFSARAYCDAGMEAGDRFGFWYVELPEHVVGYGLCALVLHGAAWLPTFRVPTALRVCASMVLVTTTLTFLAWWYFRTEGTLDGTFSDSGLCPPSNVPPWWPGWIPA